MKFEIYESKAAGRESQWFWRVRAKNGEIVFDGSEGYDSKSNVKRAIKNVRQFAANLVSCGVDDVEVQEIDVAEVADPVTETFAEVRDGRSARRPAPSSARITAAQIGQLADVFAS